MDELNKIIDRYTKGNYLIGKAAKEEMGKDILALFGVSQQRELLLDFYEHIHRKYNIEADTTFGEVYESFKANNCG